MDKPKERKTITIKINGKENPFDEKSKEKIKGQQNNSNQEKAPTPHPMDQEAAAAKEQSDDRDSFEWVLPKSTDPPALDEIKKTSDSTKKKVVNLTPKTTGFTIKKFPNKKLNLSTFFSIFFAVLLGTFLGLMLLKIVPEEKVVDPDVPAVNQEVPNPPVEEKKTNSGGLSGTRQPISAAVVQEGIYSTKESATQIKEELNKGIPAEIFTSDGQFALIVGISNTVEEAKSIGNELKSSGIDTYSKQWSIDEKNLANLHDEEKKLVEISPQVFQSFLTSVSSVNGTNKIPQDLMDSVTKQSASLGEIDKGKLQNQQIVGLHAQLEKVAAQLKDYQKNPQSSTLTKAQQHLLTFLANYQSL